jgi:hypothetical protein
MPLLHLFSEVLAATLPDAEFLYRFTGLLLFADEAVERATDDGVVSFHGIHHQSQVHTTAASSIALTLTALQQSETLTAVPDHEEPREQSDVGVQVKTECSTGASASLTRLWTLHPLSL